MAGRDYEAKYRQQGRAFKHNAMILGDESAAHTKLNLLRRRVARKGATYQHMVEVGLLEKELEARRCGACDQLRAQAWGMGQPQWLQRRCGRCWAQQAEQTSIDRHSCQHAQQTDNHTTDPHTYRPATTSNVSLAMAALSNRDPEALLAALGDRAVARMMQQHPPAAGITVAAPKSEYHDLHAGPYYHDIILGGLSPETPSAASATSSPTTEALAPAQLPSQSQPAPKITDPEGQAISKAEGHLRNNRTHPSLQRTPISQQHSSAAAKPAKQRHASARGQTALKMSPGSSVVAAHGRSDDPAQDQHVELRQALADAERLLVFGSSQEIRTEALFHASQLRQAIADLKRFDRRETVAGAVYQYRELNDPRGADGIRHKVCSKQAAALQAAAKAALSCHPPTQKHQTAMPGRRSGVPDNQIFTTVHPDWDSQPWTEPGITWRPSAATTRSKPPRDNITSAGDYVAYDYHRDLAKVRSMRVDDLKAFLRQEKRWQAELQQLKHAAARLPSGVVEALPSFEACRGLA